MKKILCSLLALFAIGIESHAQTISVAGDVEALSSGETVTVKLHIAGVTAMTSMHFEVVLPSGFSIDNGTIGIADWAATFSNEGGIAGAISSSNNAFTGEGDIASIPIIVPNTSIGLYPVTINNVRVNGEDVATTAQFNIIVTDRITLDENATTVPKARSGVNVKVKRTIKANQWSTICLPFTMTKDQADAAFGTGYAVKQYLNYTATIDENTLIPSAITLNFADYTLNALRKINAGTPYLIKTTQDIESFDVDGVTISTDLNDVSGAETNYGLTGKFKGVLAKTTVPNNGLFISKNSSDNKNKFYYSTGNTKIKAFRGWFNLEAVLNVAVSTSAPVYFSFDNETTGINLVKSEGNMANGEVYNLNGQRVMSPNKGLYIKNGKKVAVK